MSELANHIANHTNVTADEHKAAGIPVSGTVTDDHQKFLEKLFNLLEAGAIDPFAPSSMIKEEEYEKLSEQQQDAIDMELHTISSQVRLLDSFRKSHGDETSIHFHTMVEQLWDMVNRIKIENDVFKF